MLRLLCPRLVRPRLCDQIPVTLLHQSLLHRFVILPLLVKDAEQLPMLSDVIYVCTMPPGQVASAIGRCFRLGSLTNTIIH